MSKTYTPREAAILVLQKSLELAKGAMPGLQTTKLTPVPGVISPLQTNTATPNKVGSQAVVKTPKAKKMGQATDKPSVFFGKSEQYQGIKRESVKSLHSFLSNREAKKKQ